MMSTRGCYYGLPDTVVLVQPHPRHLWFAYGVVVENTPIFAYNTQLNLNLGGTS